MLTTDNRKKSRKQSGKDKIWRAALYVRLSREDGDKEESDSVVNQKDLLQQFVSFEPDITVYDVYMDDGWSGTNFERPDFIRMMADIRNGEVNCVIVKDLSRFGRNYIDVGQYIEKVFPLMDVRFISVADSLDSVKNPQTMNTIMVPFKNLINDEYCRDISNKVRSSLDMKRRQGKHIGSFACYGYKKDPEDHNHLVIDEEAAQVVREIFRWYISGMSILSISQKLNSMSVPNPASYKKKQGLNYRNTYEKSNGGKWPDSSVRRILSNQMYIGNLVQGTMKVKSYKIQISQRQEKEDWIIVEDTHEPIISREEFDTVQDLLLRNTRKAPAMAKVHLLSGYVKCGDCGRSMIRKEHHHDYGNYVYYLCRTYAKVDKTACSKHTMRADKLEKIVLASIQTQVALAVNMDEAILSINESENKNKESLHLRKLLEQTKGEVKRAEDMILDLYPDWKSGIISREEYLELKRRFDAQKSDALQKVKELQLKIEDVEKGQDGSNQFVENFKKYKNIDRLTREVIVTLIDMIYIYEDNKIKIVFKYQNPFREALEYIGNNRELLKKKQAKALFGA